MTTWAVIAVDVDLDYLVTVRVAGVFSSEAAATDAMRRLKPLTWPASDGEITYSVLPLPPVDTLIDEFAAGREGVDPVRVTVTDGRGREHEFRLTGQRDDEFAARVRSLFSRLP